MSPSIFTVNNNLNVSQDLRKSELKSDLRCLFVIREPSNTDRIIFSVILRNNYHSMINRVWFSAFVGIGNTKFGPGLDEQASFHIKSSNLGGGSYLSGYTKEEIKLPPETTLEILYFDIPKNKLSTAGSLEFYYGCESVKKLSFTAAWDEGEVGRLVKEINSQNFINFLKYKNHKTLLDRTTLFAKSFYKNFKRFLKTTKGLFVREKNF